MEIGRRRRPHSFTLVEMLVAIAILSIIVVVLLGMTTSLMSTWQFGQARNERRTNGQAVLDRITRDLRMAALPTDRTNTNTLDFVINPAGVGSMYENPQAVFWQAPVATDGSTNGNLAVVGYFVQWVTNGTSATPCLTRLLINPSSTSYYAIYSNPSNWISSSFIAANAPATAASGYAGLLAENVLGFWVQALDAQGRPIVQAGNSTPGESFDSRLSYLFTNGVSNYQNIASTSVPPSLPSAVQVAIVIIDSRTAARLGSVTLPTATLTGNFMTDVQTFYNALPAIIQKGAEIQTTTVDLANGPR